MCFYRFPTPSTARAFFILRFFANNDRFSKLATAATTTTVIPVERRAEIYVRLRVVTKSAGGRAVAYPKGLLGKGQKEKRRANTSKQTLVIKTNRSGRTTTTMHADICHNSSAVVVYATQCSPRVFHCTPRKNYYE